LNYGTGFHCKNITKSRVLQTYCVTQFTKISYFRTPGKNSEVGRRKSEVGSRSRGPKYKKNELWNLIWESDNLAKSNGLCVKVFSNYQGVSKGWNYNLTSQIRRAGDSSCIEYIWGINRAVLIAEFKKIMGMAIRSLAEVVLVYIKALRRKYHFW